MFTLECEVCCTQSPPTNSSGNVEGWTTVTIVAKSGISSTTYRCPAHPYDPANPTRNVVIAK